MKSRLLALLSAFTLLAPGPATGAAGKTDASGDTTGSGADANPPARRPSVSLGMTPEEVAKVIGQPDDSKTVATPAGDGVEWTYRRLADEWTQQIAATIQPTPAFIGLGIPGEGIGEVAVAVNHVEHVQLYQVSSLLFIGGKLAAAKQWSEKESRIEN